MLDVGFVGQVRVKPLVEPVFRDDDRGAAAAYFRRVRAGTVPQTPRPRLRSGNPGLLPPRRSFGGYVSFWCPDGSVRFVVLRSSVGWNLPLTRAREVLVMGMELREAWDRLETDVRSWLVSNSGCALIPAAVSNRIQALVRGPLDMDAHGQIMLSTADRNFIREKAEAAGMIHGPKTRETEEFFGSAGPRP